MPRVLGVLVALAATGCSLFVGDDDDPGNPCDSISTRFEACDVEVGDALLFDDGGHEFNTDTGILTEPNGTETPLGAPLPLANLYLVSTTDLDIPEGASLRVIGALPLAIAAQAGIVVAGTIDVSSNDTSRGAGSNAPACAETAAVDGVASSMDPGGGGGGGGGFGAAGGEGATGDANDNPSPGGAGGGAIVGLPDIRGGCDGGAGGDGETLGTGPDGGAGGGAIYLVSGATLEVSGTIHAGGAGGGYGTVFAGGGGGGSGGLIGLEAPSIIIETSAILASNGGGGGSGDGQLSAADGSGADAVADDERALGGDNLDDGSGTSGGAGGALSDPVGGTAVAASQGGGGGGGGVGVVLVFTDNLSREPGAIVSPASQPN